jgi:hypothetical protein
VLLRSTVGVGLSGAELALDLDRNNFFTSKGVHNIIFPWSPPTVGVPHRILKKVESRLQDKLVEVLQTLSNPTAIPVSRQTTPESSTSDDPMELNYGVGSLTDVP